jgi:dipeptidase E
MPKQIFAMGGGVLNPETGNFKLEEYILAASGAAKPRVCFVPTASGDDPIYIARFYDGYGHFDAQLSVLRFFARTPPDLRAFLFDHDVVHVGGGNTRSMLAVWRDWGFDLVLREAYERGILLCGSSAGSICWFEGGVTDSIAGDLTPLAGLGFLPGSNCPHYDGEPERRPAYQRLVGEGKLPDGIACDDGVGLHFIDGRLTRIASARPNARAYRVVRDLEIAREAPLVGVTL